MGRRIAQARLGYAKEEVLHAYANGFSLRDIAKMYKVSSNTVHRYLICNGVKPRKPGRPKKEKPNGCDQQTS